MMDHTYQIKPQTGVNKARQSDQDTAKAKGSNILIIKKEDSDEGNSQQQQQQKLATDSNSRMRWGLVNSNNNNNDNNNNDNINVDNLNQQHSIGQTPTTTATVAGGTNAAATRLMDLGKKLLEATKRGQIEIVRHLVVNAGAPFTSDWLGTTALHLAAQNGSGEIASILLKGGVNKDARTKLERTALHLAAQSGSLEVVDLLLNHGADVNARDMLKMTPLHWSSERKHVTVSERLLMAGADIEMKSKFKLTPIDIAKNAQSHDLLELFKNWITDRHVKTEDSTASAAFRNLQSCFSESHDIIDFDYHLALVNSQTRNDATGEGAGSMLDVDEPCIDLVELEWGSFEPDLFISSNESSGEEEPKVEYLMKVVEELQKENKQLRQKVEQLTTY